MLMMTFHLQDFEYAGGMTARANTAASSAFAMSKGIKGSTAITSVVVIPVFMNNAKCIAPKR